MNGDKFKERELKFWGTSIDRYLTLFLVAILVYLWQSRLEIIVR